MKLNKGKNRTVLLNILKYLTNETKNKFLKGLIYKISLIPEI